MKFDFIIKILDEERDRLKDIYFTLITTEPTEPVGEYMYQIEYLKQAIKILEKSEDR